MPTNEYNIPLLFAQTFGPRGIPFSQAYTPPTEIKPGPAEGYPDQPQIGSNDDTTFINMRNTIGAKLVTGQPVFMPVRINGLVLPNEPTMAVESQKVIVRTTLVGQKINRGSVKELIRTDDYRINIRGIAINQENKKVYPEDIIDKINKLYQLNEPVDIDSGMTALLGVYRIVIESVNFPFTPAQHAQAYEIVAYSDEDFSLFIEE